MPTLPLCQRARPLPACPNGRKAGQYRRRRNELDESTQCCCCVGTVTRMGGGVLQEALLNNISGWGNCVLVPSCLISTQHSLDPSVERKASHSTRQHSKRLEHAPDMVRQTRRHADELRPCTKQRTCPMGIERFHVHRPIPSRAHDLREPL